MLVILMMNLPQKHLFWLHLENQGYFQKRSKKCSEILTTLLIGVKFLDTVKPSRLTTRWPLKNSKPFICSLCHQQLLSLLFFFKHMKICFKVLLIPSWKVASWCIFSINLSTGNSFMEFKLNEYQPWKSITNIFGSIVLKKKGRKLSSIVPSFAICLPLAEGKWIS